MAWIRWLSRTRSIAVAAYITVAFACGGGNGGGGSITPPPSPPAAPSGLSYPTPPPLVVSQTTSLTPKVTGTVTSYSVNPTAPGRLEPEHHDGRHLRHSDNSCGMERLGDHRD